MKTRKFKIKIQNPEAFGTDFKKAWKLAESGKVIEPGYDLVLSLPNVSSISKVLSPERIRIIQMIKEKKPTSIRQLAKLLGRAQSNVQKDTQELAEFGVITFKKLRKNGSKRESMQPEYKWDGFDIAV